MTELAFRDRELSKYRLDKNIVSSTKQGATSPYPEKNQYAINILTFFLKPLNRLNLTVSQYYQLSKT